MQGHTEPCPAPCGRGKPAPSTIGGAGGLRGRGAREAGELGMLGGLGLELPAGLLGTASPGHEPAVNVHAWSFYTGVVWTRVWDAWMWICHLLAAQQDCAHNPSGRCSQRRGEHFRGTPGAFPWECPLIRRSSPSTQNLVIALLSTHPTSIKHPPAPQPGPSGRPLLSLFRMYVPADPFAKPDICRSHFSDKETREVIER